MYLNEKNAVIFTWNMASLWGLGANLTGETCYLTISHWRWREYRQIVTETKSRWLSLYSQSLRWLIVLVKVHRLVIIWENKTKTKICNSKTSTNLVTILKTESHHCYNHPAVIIARAIKVLDQSACTIFDNHQCNFTKMGWLDCSWWDWPCSIEK